MPNENNSYRGLHIVIINPLNGKVVHAKAFDTHDRSDGIDNFFMK